MLQPHLAASALPGIYVSHALRVPAGSASSPAAATSGVAPAPEPEPTIATPPQAGFSAAERAHLLLSPRIGPKLVLHLERAGFVSLAQMRELGARSVLARVYDTLGIPVYLNRTRALERAIQPTPPDRASGGRASRVSVRGPLAFWHLESLPSSRIDAAVLPPPAS